MKNKNTDQLTRKALLKLQKQQLSSYFEPLKNILNGISKRSTQISKNKTDPKKFDDLYNLLHNKYFLIQALGNIKSNKGSLTPGVTKETIDSISINKIEELCKSIKENSFKFSPIRRKYIIKAKRYKFGEKKKMRPLGIPNFSDRIIQEAIRMILEAIYEPIFIELDYNYGFRPKRGCHHAIMKIKREATSSNFAIEGDIESAYDNVNLDIMINILKEKISDNKFLKLLKQGFQSGVLDHGIIQQTNLGVPQGGLASTVLFNIYMHKFDEFVNRDLQSYINVYNKVHNRTDKPRYKLYNNTQSRLDRIRHKYLLIKNQRKWTDLNDSEKIQLLELRKRIKELTLLRAKLPSIKQKYKSIRIIYARYADDWIIFTNSTKEFAENLKERIQDWLLVNLKLTLSSSKTRITNLNNNSAKFLGFTIRSYRKRKLSLNPKGELTKTAGWNMIIDIDAQKAIDKLFIKGFINKNNKPVAKRPWTVLSAQDIITKYNYMFRGIANYYLPVLDRLTQFQRLCYYLKFSCLSTFAKKFKTKITKITKKFGDPLTMKITETITLKKLNKQITSEKSFTLLNYQTLKKLLKYKKYDFSSKTLNIPDPDYFKSIQLVNWRTLKNLTNCCCICGTYENVELHHIRHIRKGKVLGFSQVMKQLNRKMIPVCKIHHNEIHQGIYDNIKLSELIGLERFLS